MGHYSPFPFFSGDEETIVLIVFEFIVCVELLSLNLIAIVHKYFYWCSISKCRTDVSVGSALEDVAKLFQCGCTNLVSSLLYTCYSTS